MNRNIYYGKFTTEMIAPSRRHWELMTHAGVPVCVEGVGVWEGESLEESETCCL